MLGIKTSSAWVGSENECSSVKNGSRLSSGHRHKTTLWIAYLHLCTSQAAHDSSVCLGRRSSKFAIHSMTIAPRCSILQRHSFSTQAASCSKLWHSPLARHAPKTRTASTVQRRALSKRDLKKLARNAGRRLAALVYDATTAKPPSPRRTSSGRAPRPRARFDPALEAAKPQWDRKRADRVDIRMRADGGDKLQAVICAALPNMPAWHVAACHREPQSASLVATARGSGRVAGGLVFLSAWSRKPSRISSASSGAAAQARRAASTRSIASRRRPRPSSRAPSSASPSMAMPMAPPAQTRV